MTSKVSIFLLPYTVPFVTRTITDMLTDFITKIAMLEKFVTWTIMVSQHISYMILKIIRKNKLTSEWLMCMFRLFYVVTWCQIMWIKSFKKMFITRGKYEHTLIHYGTTYIYKLHLQVLKQDASYKNTLSWNYMKIILEKPPNIKLHDDIDKEELFWLIQLIFNWKHAMVQYVWWGTWWLKM